MIRNRAEIVTGGDLDQNLSVSVQRSSGASDKTCPGGFVDSSNRLRAPMNVDNTVDTEWSCIIRYTCRLFLLRCDNLDSTLYAASMHEVDVVNVTTGKWPTKLGLLPSFP